jgi:hypothetical protein
MEKAKDLGYSDNSKETNLLEEVSKLLGAYSQRIKNSRSAS